MSIAAIGILIFLVFCDVSAKECWSDQIHWPFENHFVLFQVVISRSENYKLTVSTVPIEEIFSIDINKPIHDTPTNKVFKGMQGKSKLL